MRPFLKSREGGATLEFALLAPICLSLLFGAIAMGVAAWDKNIIQGVAYETARCVALSATPCSTVPSGCDSTVPGICFATTRAADRGLSSVRPSDVALDPGATINGMNFTTVAITYQFRLAGYSIALTGYSAFPNGG